MKTQMKRETRKKKKLKKKTKMNKETKKEKRNKNQKKTTKRVREKAPGGNSQGPRTIFEAKERKMKMPKG